MMAPITLVTATLSRPVVRGLQDYEAVWCYFGLVARVPGHRSRGPGFHSRRFFLEAVGPERGPLSLVTIMKQLTDISSSGSGLGNRD
jgi:hypothetical protein